MGDLERDPISLVFSAIRNGEPGAERRLFELAYTELRRMAHGKMFHEAPGNTLQTTGLVNEAYLRLCRGEDANWENRRHFFGAAAIAMRRILIDHWRKKQAAGYQHRVTLGDDVADSERPFDLIVLDAALEHLAKIRPRAAEVVSYRFFLGLTVKETAKLLGVAPKTVDNDWALARAWLRREMNRQSDAPSACSE